MPDWEKRVYIRCAIEDERRHRAEIREVLEFAVKTMYGSSDEPTEENPVTSSHSMSERSQVQVKKVLDFKHKERMDALAADSMRLKSEGDDLLKKVLEQARIDLAKKKGATDG